MSRKNTYKEHLLYNEKERNVKNTNIVFDPYCFCVRIMQKFDGPMPNGVPRPEVVRGRECKSTYLPTTAATSRDLGEAGIRTTHCRSFHTM